MSREQIKGIPYGVSDYTRIREKNLLYIDKTRFIPLLERGFYLFLIRPRRFGKSLHLIMLETYYDLWWKEKFDRLFEGTWIHSNPTEEQGTYMILKFNFSGVNPDPMKLEDSFEAYIEITLNQFASKYAFLLGDKFSERIGDYKSAYNKLHYLISFLAGKEQKLYVMIDEYDNFANTILASEGEARYKAITHGEGFLRLFFNILKQGTTSAGAGISRLFITGVSPLVMDDVTSGFNIGKNISQDPRFNEMIGFTEQEVEGILDYYIDAGTLKLEKKILMEMMSHWYNGYLFSTKAETPMYNTDMVLYFLDQCTALGMIPDKLIDQNVRIDYGKLRHLIVLDRRLNGNFSKLKEIIETGETGAQLADSFPLEKLTHPDNFISLLYSFGLLSPRERAMGKTMLRIPNQTVREFFYRYMAESYEDVNLFKLEMLTFYNLMADMAYKGSWQEVFDYLGRELKDQTKIRDYLTGEKVIQGFFLAYLNLPGHYIVHSEYQLNKGYADLYFEPFFAAYHDMPYSYILELKYLTREEYKAGKLPAVIADAENQLVGYKKDASLQKTMRNTKIRPLIVVFAGWEMVHREEFD